MSRLSVYLVVGLFACSPSSTTPSAKANTHAASNEPAAPSSAEALALPGASDPEPPPEEGKTGSPTPDAAVATALNTNPDDSTSIGSTIEGRLDGGLALPATGPGFRHNPSKDPQRRYGTVEMVRALIRAAGVVHERSPGGEVTINDLSAQAGGDIPGHATHRSGRDVDVLFYLLDADDHPRSGHAVPLEPDGRGVDYRDLAVAEDDIPVRIDVPRTWQFVEALIADTDALLQQIYIVEHLRTMLLEHARRTGSPEWIVSRFAAITCQPKFPHDDHMHMRFFCSPQDIRAGCLDDKPIYPWHRNELSGHGLRAQIAGPRTSPRPQLTSIEQARADAGPMHADVVAFLERRQAWARKPKARRKYCQ